jgi:phosphate transport system substrate-binding protein
MQRRHLVLLSLFGLFFGAGQVHAATKITAVGSTALQPLIEQAATRYEDKNSAVQITVQGGGSGTGLSQVASGAVTIGNSDIFAEEASGIKAKKLVDHKVAVVGFAPVVNKATGVKNLSQKQLIAIFSGKITNWKAVGGKNLPISVVNRAAGSGTRASFEKYGLHNAKVIQSQEQDSSGTVKKIVSQTPGAISYLAFSYLDKSVQALNLDHVKPTEKNITTNKWRIWSYEHLYTKGSPATPTVRFIKYVQSNAVQKKLVKKLGYIAINRMHVERTATGQINDIGNK